MSTFDKTIIVGNVGGDPVLKYTSDGVAVIDFSIAVNRYKGKDKEPQTMWYKATAWRGLAELLIQYVKKGSQIYLEGELTPRIYADKKTGELRISNDFTIKDFQFIGGKPEGHAALQDQEQPVAEPIPF